MEKTVVCKYCHAKINWGSGDEYHGNIWECEECGETFCEKCAIGLTSVRHFCDMVSGDSDKEILCPSCDPRWTKVTLKRGA